MVLGEQWGIGWALMVWQEWESSSSHGKIGTGNPELPWYQENQEGRVELLRNNENYRKPSWAIRNPSKLPWYYGKRKAWAFMVLEELRGMGLAYMVLWELWITHLSYQRPAWTLMVLQELGSLRSYCTRGTTGDWLISFSMIGMRRQELSWYQENHREWVELPWY
jgi:hypothetical protein